MLTGGGASLHLEGMFCFISQGDRVNANGKTQKLDSSCEELRTLSCVQRGQGLRALDSTSQSQPLPGHLKKHLELLSRLGISNVVDILKFHDGVPGVTISVKVVHFPILPPRKHVQCGFAEGLGEVLRKSVKICPDRGDIPPVLMLIMGHFTLLEVSVMHYKH